MNTKPQSYVNISIQEHLNVHAAVGIERFKINSLFKVKFPNTLRMGISDFY